MNQNQLKSDNDIRNIIKIISQRFLQNPMEEAIFYIIDIEDLFIYIKIMNS